jgi:hypothetical protein
LHGTWAAKWPDMGASSIASVMCCGLSAALLGACWGESFEAANDDERGGAESIPEQPAPASTPVTTPSGNVPAAPAPTSTPDDITSPISCADAVAPSVPLICPAECTGGCNAGTCRIACTGNDSCREQALVCPPGMDCEIACNGDHACEKARVQCGPLHACRIICMGEAACKETTLNCGAGSCDVDCRAEKACEKTDVNCGSGACSIQGTGAKAACGASCACATPGGDTEEPED